VTIGSFVSAIAVITFGGVQSEVEPKTFTERTR